MIALADILAALKSQIADATGLRVEDFIPGSPNPPAAFILPPDIDYQQAFRHGVIRLELDVAIIVSASVDRSQKNMFSYLDWSGPQSVVAAIDADKTLGLDGINAIPTAARQLGLSDLAGATGWGAAIHVVILSTTS